MANLQDAKAEVAKLFTKALPPSSPHPVNFTTVEQITRPVFQNGNVLSRSAHDLIQGSLVPGDEAKWVVADHFVTSYLNMVQNMAYGLSTADKNRITDLETKNANVLNSLITTYEKVYGRITPEQMTTAGVTTKIDYFTAQVDTLKKSMNWGKFAADYNSAQADIDIMSNINAAKVEFARQIKGIKTNIEKPTATNGGIQAYDQNNNKVWYPGYNVDPNFPSKFANGKNVDIVIDMMDVATNSQSFSINGKGGFSWSGFFLGVSGSNSTEYNESSYKSLMSKVRIKLQYTNVCYLQAAATGLSANNTIGWYLPDIVRQAYNKSAADTGPYFMTDEKALKEELEKGGLQALRGLLVSPAASGSMQFASDDYSSFQKYFHTESHASVNLFGFIPVASANTSYTKSSSGATDQGFKMEVQLNNSGDVNNLVTHGAVLDNPIQD